MWSSVFSTLFTMRFLQAIIRLATPIVFAALGAFTAASTGIGNIAIESIMTFSALAGVLGSYLFNNAWLGVICGLAIGIWGVGLYWLAGYIYMRQGLQLLKNDRDHKD